MLYFWRNFAILASLVVYLTGARITWTKENKGLSLRVKVLPGLPFLLVYPRVPY